MRKWIIWSFDRGSFQYDVLCGLILIAIFAIPTAVFNDRPDYMRLPAEGGQVRRVLDDDGNAVYSVKVSSEWSGRQEQAARERLGSFLEPAEFDISRVEPVYNTLGGVSGYAFWVVGPDAR